MRPWWGGRRSCGFNPFLHPSPAWLFQASLFFGCLSLRLTAGLWRLNPFKPACLGSVSTGSCPGFLHPPFPHPQLALECPPCPGASLPLTLSGRALRAHAPCLARSWAGPGGLLCSHLLVLDGKRGPGVALLPRGMLGYTRQGPPSACWVATCLDSHSTGPGHVFRSPGHWCCRVAG